MTSGLGLSFVSGDKLVGDVVEVVTRLAGMLSRLASIIMPYVS
jgi:hypothetical protein